MELTRKQLLEMAIAEGMEITDDQIRRHIRQGLLPRRKVGKGYSRGIDTFFNKTSLEALRKIVQIRDNRHIRNESEMIYPLFAMGFPVDLEVLLDNYLKQVDEATQSMESLVLNIENGDWAAWFMEETAKKSLPPLKPGKPSKAILQERRDQIEADIAVFQVMFRMLSFFIGGQTIPGKLIVQLGQQSKKHGFDPEAAEQITTWLDRQRWTTTLQNASEDDFAAIQKVFERLQEYIDVLATVHFYELHRLAGCGKKNLGELRLIELPMFAKFIILGLLEPTWRKSIFDFLMNEEIYQTWLEICSKFNQKAEKEEE